MMSLNGGCNGKNTKRKYPIFKSAEYYYFITIV